MGIGTGRGSLQNEQPEGAVVRGYSEGVVDGIVGPQIS